MVKVHSLIPGMCIEDVYTHEVFIIQSLTSQVIVLKNISTDVFHSLPVSSINFDNYQIVEVVPNYIMD